MKTYGHYCPIAHSLGLVGERWTLLVVQRTAARPEALHRPRRPLARDRTNVLAARLKELEAGGIVEKRKLPPPFSSTVYELTPAGRQLRPVLHELARFGARLMGPPPPTLTEGWLVGALDLALSPFAAARRSRSGSAKEASLVDCTAVPGIAEDYDVLVETDATGFYHLVVDRRLEGVRIDGDARAALDQLLDGFAPSPLPA